MTLYERIRTALSEGDLNTARGLAEYAAVTEVEPARDLPRVLPDLLAIRAATLLHNCMWLDVSFLRDGEDIRVGSVSPVILDRTSQMGSPEHHIDPQRLLEINPLGCHSVDVAWNVLYNTCEVLRLTRPIPDGADRSLLWEYPNAYDPSTGETVDLHPDQESRSRRIK